MSTNIWNNLKILIVEDSPTQAILLEELLKGQGAQVTMTVNGKKGLEAAKADLPDIIISDVEMPEMTGYELCRQIKSDEALKQIPVILFTALSDTSDVIEGIQCGADNFITKPCNNALLFSCVENLVGNINRAQISDGQQTIEVNFGGLRHTLHVSHQQITELLLSTYASAIEKNKELEESNHKLNALHLELKKRSMELAAASEEKNKLLGMAAHDLRNPLYAIQEYSKMLHGQLSEEIEPRYLKMLSRIHSSSNLMSNIINDMLDISVIESGKVKLNFHQQNLLSLLTENMELNERVAENKNIKLVVKHDENIPDILCDPSKIEQVLNNLIGNAIKFSGSGTEVEVSLTRNQEEIKIAVKDHGPGISEADQEKVFRSFMRVNSKDKTSVEGTGLGLAIVKKIIEGHGGHISLASKEGQGSTFSVTLPINLKKTVEPVERSARFGTEGITAG